MQNFMFPVPEASMPAVEICSERSAAGIDPLAVLDGEVRKKDDLEAIAHGRIAIDDVADGVDQLDDELGEMIARERLCRQR